MKAAVPSLTVTRATIGRVAVGQVAVGPIRVARLTAQDAVIGVDSGRAQLRGVSLSVRLDFALEWSIGIDLPFPLPDFEAGDTSDLGGVTIPFPPVDADIPGLRDISVRIPALQGQNVQVAADPISGLALDGVVADGVRATGVVLPAQDATLTGIGLSGLELEGVGVPAAVVAGASIDRVTGAPLALDRLTLRGLTLPAAGADDITSTGFDVPFTLADGAGIRLPGLDLGVLRVTLIVRPSASAHIDRLHLSDVTAAATVGTIELQDVTLPYEALNLTLADLGVDTIEIPTIGVS